MLHSTITQRSHIFLYSTVSLLSLDHIHCHVTVTLHTYITPFSTVICLTYIVPYSTYQVLMLYLHCTYQTQHTRDQKQHEKTPFRATPFEYLLTPLTKCSLEGRKGSFTLLNLLRMLNSYLVEFI